MVKVDGAESWRGVTSGWRSLESGGWELVSSAEAESVHPTLGLPARRAGAFPCLPSGLGRDEA